jgi:hypothetical protein
MHCLRPTASYCVTLSHTHKIPLLLSFLMLRLLRCILSYSFLFDVFPSFVSLIMGRIIRKYSSQNKQTICVCEPALIIFTYQKHINLPRAQMSPKLLDSSPLGNLIRMRMGLLASQNHRAIYLPSSLRSASFLSVAQAPAISMMSAAPPATPFVVAEDRRRKIVVATDDGCHRAPSAQAKRRTPEVLFVWLRDSEKMEGFFWKSGGLGHMGAVQVRTPLPGHRYLPEELVTGGHRWS